MPFNLTIKVFLIFLLLINLEIYDNIMIKIE